MFYLVYKIDIISPVNCLIYCLTSLFQSLVCLSLFSLFLSLSSPAYSYHHPSSHLFAFSLCSFTYLSLLPSHSTASFTFPSIPFHSILLCHSHTLTSSPLAFPPLIKVTFHWDCTFYDYIWQINLIDWSFNQSHSLQTYHIQVHVLSMAQTMYSMHMCVYRAAGDVHTLLPYINIYVSA